MIFCGVHLLFYAAQATAQHCIIYNITWNEWAILISNKNDLLLIFKDNNNKFILCLFMKRFRFDLYFYLCFSPTCREIMNFNFFWSQRCANKTYYW